MTTHELKTLRGYFQAIQLGRKTFEVRFNDRNFRLGDDLLLQEFDNKTKEYTGDEVLCHITYILDNPNYVKEGYVVMSIKVLEIKSEADGKE